jgi:hypothetical protein
MPAGEPLLRGAAPCACRARRCASPSIGRWGVGGAPARVRFTVSGERRSWARRVARMFAEPSGALAARQKNRRARGGCGRVEPIQPFLRTAAAAAGGAAQLRGREHPSKIGRLAHYNFAQCCVGGRWRAWALHACMCARARKCHFRARFPQLRVSQSCCGAGT